MKKNNEFSQKKDILKTLKIMRILMAFIGTIGLVLFFTYMMKEQESGRADYYMDFFTNPLFPMFIIPPFIAIRFLNKEIRKQSNIKDCV